MASRAFADHGPRWGVLNLDAHFDLREEERPTSGTPFAQIAAAEREAGRALDYAVLGIAESSNTAVLFERARALGVRWMTDLERSEEHTSELQSRGHLVCRLLLENKKRDTRARSGSE